MRATIPVCPFPATMCRTLFPLSSLAVASASGPKLETNCWMSCTSPYLHDSSNSSRSSRVGVDSDIAGLRSRTSNENEKIRDVAEGWRTDLARLDYPVRQYVMGTPTASRL